MKADKFVSNAPLTKRPPSVKTTHKLETDVQYNQSVYLRSCLINISLPRRRF